MDWILVLGWGSPIGIGIFLVLLGFMIFLLFPHFPQLPFDIRVIIRRRIPSYQDLSSYNIAKL